MKVMIVEDDMLVRLGIKSMIPWSELGLEVVCEARDGLEALDFFSKHLPNIVLVDIGLPKLGGLEFIEQAREICSDSEFIILTCNKDFEMVRKSLRLEVYDFIVKSTMEIETLTQVVENLVAQMQEKKIGNTSSLEAESNNSLKRIQQKSFLRDWLNGFYTNSDTIEKKARESGIDFQDMNFQAWVVQLDTLFRNGKELLPNDLDKIGYAIENIAIELFRDHFLGFVEDVRRKQWHVIVHYDSFSVSAKKLSEAVNRYLGYEISVGCSKNFYGLADWFRKDKEAVDSLLLKYYNQKENLFYDGDIFTNTVSPDILKWKKDILKSLSFLNFEEADASFVTLEKFLYIQPRPHPNLIINLLTDILSKLENLNENFGSQSDVDKSQKKSQAYSLKNKYLMDSLRFVRCEILKIKVSLCEDSSKREKRLVIKTIESYIDEYPFEEISLNHIADHMNITPAYLSRLFKEETGKSFTDFVLATKVEKAVQMMKNGLSVTETAERLGYLNVSSFTRMFKKVKGLNPSYFIS